MNIKKTSACILFAVILLLAIPSFVWAEKPQTRNDNSETIQIMFSVYDDIQDKFVLENTKLDINSGDTLLDVFAKLKKNQSIRSYDIEDNNVVAITANDNTLYSRDSQSQGTTIISKINAATMSSANINTILKNGDIIEIFYTTKNAQSAQTSNTMTSEIQTKVTKITLWDTELVKVFNDSFEWLNRNIDSSTSYLLVSGISSKAPTVKSMNVFLGEVQKKKQYSTPSEIAKDVLSLTVNGVDASTEKNNQLIQKLTSYKDIMSMGIFGAVNTLTAYNCSDYPVPDNSINSRTVLVSNILAYQNEDGGFPIQQGGDSDIDATAMTITSLSLYTDQPQVNEAIDNAVEYLSTNQSADGGFGYMGKSNLESLSTVIVALNSLEIDLNDERFKKGNKTLIQNFLQYRNNDGGFAHIIGDKSTSMPTEQALIALTSIKKSGNPYRMITPLQTNAEADSTENISMRLDNAPTIVFIAIILAILSIATISILFIGKKSTKKK